MDVKKIFIILITVVACVIVGALVLNILLPNVSKALINSIEGMIYNATKMSFDFNGDGVGGSAAASGAWGSMVSNSGSTASGAGVTGFN